MTMRSLTRIGVAMTVLIGLASAPALAEVEVGQKAPELELEDQAGNRVTLDDHEGSVVVLEWVNPDCPFVQRHHAAGTMKKLAETYAPKGVVWLGVNSTHYMDAEASADFREKHELPYPILVDASGKVGRSYGAVTTPHMFIIDEEGTVVYEGAIDDDPRGQKSSAENYVANALDEVVNDRPVSVAATTPYGCSVKYAKE